MCPRCGCELTTYLVFNVPIARCGRCLGMWLNTGELGMICAELGLEHGRLSHVLGTARSVRVSRWSCPRCDGPMQVLSLGDDQAAKLDFCGGGHGLWCDQNEMREAMRCMDPAGQLAGQTLEDLLDLELPQEAASTRPATSDGW